MTAAKEAEQVSFLKALGDREEDVRLAVLEVAKQNAKRDGSGSMAGPCLTFLEDETEKEGVHVSIFSIVCQLAESATEMETSSVTSLASVSFRFLTDVKKNNRKLQHAAAEALVALTKRDFSLVVNQIIDGISPSEVPNLEVFWTIKEISDNSFLSLAPMLSSLMSKLLPTLGNIKGDPLKKIVCQTFKSIAEGIEEVWGARARGEQQDGEEEEKKEEEYALSVDIFKDLKLLLKTVIDLFAGTWLNLREPAVKPDNLEVIGVLLQACERETLDLYFSKNLAQSLPYCKTVSVESMKVLNGVMGMIQSVKKLNLEAELIDSVVVTNILSVFLNVAASDIDYSTTDKDKMQASIKCKNYVLKTTEVLFQLMPHECSLFILKTLEARGNEVQKVGILNVIKHLLTHVSHLFELEQQNLLISGMKNFADGILASSTYFSMMAQYPNYLNMVRSLVQTILALATSGFLILEGGESLIDFLLQLSCLKWSREYPLVVKKFKNADGIARELQGLCERNLTIVATTIDALDKVMFPFLLERFIAGENARLGSLVCKCTSEVMVRIIETTESKDICEYVSADEVKRHMPSSHEILSRIFALLYVPKSQKGIQENGLQFLYALRQYFISADHQEDFGSLAQKLLTTLKENKANSGLDLDIQIWQRKVLDLFKVLFAEEREVDWITSLCLEFKTLMASFRKATIKESSSLVAACVTLTGICLQNIQKRDFVREALQDVYSYVELSNYEEQSAFASCCGNVGHSHLDVALEKIKFCTAPPEKETKKSSFGFFSFSSSSSNDKGSPTKAKDDDVSKATAALAYGFCASYANVELLSSRLQTHILGNMTGDLKEMKTLQGLLAYSTSVINIVDAVKDARESGATVKISSSPDLLLCLLEQMERSCSEITAGIDPSSTVDNPLYVGDFQLKAGIKLLELERKTIPSEVQQSFLVMTINFVKAATSLDGREYIVDVEQMINTCRHTFTALLDAKQASEGPFCKLFTDIVQDLLSSTLHMRNCKGKEHIMWLVLCTIQYFRDKSSEVTAKSRMALRAGITFSRLIAKFCETDVKLRSMALIAIEYTLDIMKKASGDAIASVDTTPLGKLKQTIKDVDSAEAMEDMFRELGIVVDCVDKALENSEAVELVCDLKTIVKDVEASVPHGAGFSANKILCARAESIEESSGHISYTFLEVAQALSGREESKKLQYGMLQTLRMFIERVRDKSMIFDMTLQSIYNESGTRMTDALIEVLLSSMDVVRALVNHVLTKINVKNIEKIIGSAKQETGGMTVRMDLASSKALCSIFKCAHTNLEVKTFISSEAFAPLICNLLMFVGHYESNKWESSLGEMSTCIAALCDFFSIPMAKANALKLETWAANHQDFLNNVGSVASEAIRDSASHQQQVFDFCSHTLRSQSSSPELTTICHSILSNMASIAIESELQGTIASHLIVYVGDLQMDIAIRKQCMHGLSLLPSEQTNSFATEIIASLSSNIDSTISELSVFALKVLEEELTKLDQTQFVPIALNLFNKLRDKLENRDPSIRSASCDVFGKFSVFKECLETNSALMERMHTALVGLYLRVGDEDHMVRHSAKKALRMLGELFGEESLVSMFDASEFDPDRKLDFSYFSWEFCSCLVSLRGGERANQYLEAAAQYFEHSSPNLSGNSIFLAGCMLANCTGGDKYLSESLVSRVKMQASRMKEKAVDVFVRKNAAIAFGLMLRCTI
ncbi:hypothetical protein A3770_05p38300 [Chloropicon primus]|uniref:Uncharacterized protein n=1 Tax=Chloropicon primus TaxID=1764295 RepID=A0A5B8MPV1_9CHLO|nr:hypothetical protein A3770_05p38300 [Chloropicon primus]|eukprot:QDZ21312.1 hypothetical protein A3770_05p38300 [Chloropicon primus]